MEATVPGTPGGESLLVLCDTYYPEWQARLDGRRGRIMPADQVFRSLALGPGRHTVLFTLEPRSFRLGLVISLATFGLLMARWAAKFTRGSRTGSTKRSHTCVW
jgi:uncharacterized membrane protein YfhO